MSANARSEVVGLITRDGKAKSEAPKPDAQSRPWVDVKKREVKLTSAATIKPRPVFWLWEGRIALGTLALLAGREGLGKSTVGYWLAARITRGELPGEYTGRPRGVLVCATEDSWEHTIVPRLMAAGADLLHVYRVDVATSEEYTVGLTLPRDLVSLEKEARAASGALLLLDPLMSRLGEDLDTHKDGDVQRALEPLVSVADRSGMAVLGLIHHNKSGSSDPLQLVMGSKAFTAVARSVHTVIPDPDDDTDQRRVFGTPKNNLGRGDLPSLGFNIVSHPIDTDEGTAWTGRVEWTGEIDGSIADAMRRATDNADDRSAASEAAGWLNDYVMSKAGQVTSAEAKKAGHAAGHSDAALRRARERLKLTVESYGFPRVTTWNLPVVPVASPSRVTAPRGDDVTDTTDTTTETRGL